MKLTSTERVAWIAVVVAGLGYFVDVFDMWLFTNFRVASLKDLGLSDKEVTDVGVYLLNWQQAGFLAGGFLWGIMGDKKGRAQVMFGSILVYSLATLLNAFVTNTTQYAICRFISGVGLAGEIGAGITLIAELLPKTQRGIGTTFVTALGVSGAIASATAGKYLDWKTAYIFGGLLGLILLFLRLWVHESGMYEKSKLENVPRGSLFLIFSSQKRILKYLSCIVLGIPIYLCFGLFVSFSPEIAKAIGITESFKVPDIMIYASVGITVGDLFAGILSQILKSRKKPILILLTISGVFSYLLFSSYTDSLFKYQMLILGISVSVGYWACLITTAAEQFGTNIRATVTTTVPNLIRGSSILITLAFASLKQNYDVIQSILIITSVIYFFCFVSFLVLKETFHEDLDYLEKNDA